MIVPPGKSAPTAQEPRTVEVPPTLAPLFREAEAAVSAYYSKITRSPERGTIDVLGERYLLVRGAALSVEFFSLSQELFGDGREAESMEFARNLLYDLAHAVGKSDAKKFQAKMGLTEPLAKLSAGPVHFAHAGWARVKLNPDSVPSPNDDFYLNYEHPQTFEADAWLNEGREPHFPVCVMNAGYSAGWCEASFELRLVATEVRCRARGDSCCQFIMAPPHRIREHAERFSSGASEFLPSPSQLQAATDLFERKRLEQDLRRSEALHRGICESMFDAITIVKSNSKIVACNPSASRLFGCETESLEGQRLAEFLEPCGGTPLGDWTQSNSDEFTGQAFATRLTRRDGCELDVELLCTQLEYQGSPHALVVIRDVTKRKQAEAELAAAHARVVESSREAGKAEIATGVLHNVGNVLNSVNVSAGLVSDLLNDRISRRLGKTVEKLREHKHDLPGFLAEDNRAEQLTQLLANIHSETQEAVDELRCLRENVEHIKVIVVAQQTYSTLGAMISQFDVSEAARDAIHLCQEGFGKRGIDLRAEGDAVEINSDKHRLLQILVNLLKNAQEAVCQHSVGLAEVVIETKRVTEKEVEICVHDSGVGIERENLEKIFSHGYSSRKESGGHGFGLHHSANTASELGGSLTAYSDGLGHGATFKLVLPIQR